MFVYNEILLYFYIIKAKVEVIAKGNVCKTKKKKTCWNYLMEINLSPETA